MPDITINEAYLLHDGRTLMLRGTFATPSDIGVLDWLPNWATARKRLTGVGLLSLQYVSVMRGTPTGGTTTVELRYWIDDAAEVITRGQTGLRFVCDAGIVEDIYGNRVGATNIAVTNYSLAGSDGFLATDFTPTTTIYVSSTEGSDSHNLTQAQNPATPLASIAQALTFVGTTSHTRICLLQGDTFTANVDMGSKGGTSLAQPLIVEPYAHDYGSGLQGAIRPTIEAASGYILDGGGSYIVFSGIRFYGTTTSATGRPVGVECSSGSHRAFFDCVIEQVAGGFYQEGFAGQEFLSLVRTWIMDVANSGAHNQGVYSRYCTIGFLISQCLADRCGYKDSAYTESTIYDRNFYIDDDQDNAGTGPAGVVATWSLRSGSDSIQNRPGGGVYGCVHDDNAYGPWVGGFGGRTARNFSTRNGEIRHPTTPDPRGFGYVLHGSSGDWGFGGPVILELSSATKHISTDPINASAVRISSIITGQENWTHQWIRNLVAIDAGPIDYPSTDCRSVRRLSCAIDNSGVDIARKRRQAVALQGGVAASVSDGDHHRVNSVVLAEAYEIIYDNRVSRATYLASIPYTDIVEVAWTCLNRDVDLGDWRAHNGLSDAIGDHYSAMRARALGEWSDYFDAVKAADWLNSQVRPTALIPYGAGVLQVYGTPADPDPSRQVVGAFDVTNLAANQTGEGQATATWDSIDPPGTEFTVEWDGPTSGSTTTTNKSASFGVVAGSYTVTVTPTGGNPVEAPLEVGGPTGVGLSFGGGLLLIGRPFGG